MFSPRQSLDAVRSFAARAPAIAWIAAGTIGVALAAAMYLEMSGPRYVPLFDGLTPAQGGQVIAGLQKLGIPYQLSAAGNLIQVPADQLALARLQLGAQQLPASDTRSAWSKLESAPLTTSDLAQSAMATQALEASLEQSIEALNGVRSAQVFIALPKETPFLADQPKPTASVMIDATGGAEASLGPTIAHLVAGAVPGLAPDQINVSTTSGTQLFPADESHSTITSQMQTISRIEDAAAARLSNLLTPIIGRDHFRIAVAANVDFTRMQTHETLFGPKQMLNTEEQHTLRQIGSETAALGIPGALSNAPPAATTANPAPIPPPANANQAAPANGQTPAAANAASAGANSSTQAASSSQSTTAPPQPVRSSESSTRSYLTDRQESDITPPAWQIKAISTSVVLDKTALKAVSPAQIQKLIAAAFSLPNVSVTVTTAPFLPVSTLARPFQLQNAIGPVSQAILEVVAALALLFGLALPLGRRIGAVTPAQPMLAMPKLVEEAKTSPPPEADIHLALASAPRATYLALREEVVKNVPSVAKLLQSWTEDNE
ncbi:flagellar basal-body MS-ring/collar protein FliF [Acidisoma sp. C75]